MAFDPIRLGSASGSTLVFESGSNITTSDSGIQSCSVKALYADGSTVFNVIPAAGVGFNSIFGNNYLPSTFLVDYTDGGPSIEYVEGRVARITISFKRQDPAQIGVRKIFVDSVLNYNSPLLTSTLNIIGGATGQDSQGGFFNPSASFSSIVGAGKFGFPEPVVTVKYNANSRPVLGGDISSLYALQGSTRAQGFPTISNVDVPYTVPLTVGAYVTYFDESGLTPIVVGPLLADTTFNFNMVFRPNPLGWQLQRLKSDPVAAASFYDIEEEWRTFYFFFKTTLISTIPPLPP